MEQTANQFLGREPVGRLINCLSDGVSSPLNGNPKNRSPRNQISRTYFRKKYVLNKLRLHNKISVYFKAPSVILFRRSLSIGSESFSILSPVKPSKK